MIKPIAHQEQQHMTPKKSWSTTALIMQNSVSKLDNVLHELTPRAAKFQLLTKEEKAFDIEMRGALAAKATQNN